jgi:hypothetical protein
MAATSIPTPGVPGAPCLGLAVAGGVAVWGALGAALALLLA